MFTLLFSLSSKSYSDEGLANLKKKKKEEVIFVVYGVT